MITVVIHETKVVKILRGGNELGINNKNIGKCFVKLAKDFPDDILIWSEERFFKNINYQAIAAHFQNRLTMVSFAVNGEFFINNRIGYIDSSAMLKMSKQHAMASWRMSANVGALNASIVNAYENDFLRDFPFEYTLTSIAKRAMPKGLFCYHDPKILKDTFDVVETNFNPQYAYLFKFAKEHYKSVWIYFLLISFLIYDKRCMIFSFFKGVTLKRKSAVQLKENKMSVVDGSALESSTIDVIIPTIGRKKYLYDVLVDLKNQTHLPKKVIIVEQNPVKNSTSELEYLSTENWPFEIIHEFTNIAGVCRARNIALDHATSDYLFLADDDIRIELSFIKEALTKMINLDVKGVTFSCLKPNQDKSYFIDHQTGIFGSGCSIIENSGIKFDQKFEFGFGEDLEFGMQLRESGIDIIFFSVPEIIHLKAPMGGFRTKFIHKWDNEKIQPKPSPTVLYSKQKHGVQEQILGYKMLLFFNELKRVSFSELPTFLSQFQKKWEASKYWAERL
ncbi:Glycosyltransferase, GT2 family [Pustulibacterium marinum]|uniref:Glycosyltransferase, GT2 family n=1 Tax=Pustulibacterium marinum TaxID=1224947 RepID=A0A1I7HMU5_9FLAO|nr:glycosyltransferase family 2 protein [Pustulibacterium marinum]SFU62045.1 Glycosyltransferase, GT2 family [Pustulibacterium marinum]